MLCPDYPRRVMRADQVASSITISCSISGVVNPTAMTVAAITAATTINPARHMAAPAIRRPFRVERANRPERGAGHGAPRHTHRSIQNHLANHPRPDGYTKQVGATRDVRSLMRQHIRETPEKSADLCPFPFPFQIWFDGDAVREQSASRRSRGRS